MTINLIGCPGGKFSQSGEACSARYHGIPIENLESVQATQEYLARGNATCVAPLWNSHVGEVPFATYVWGAIEKAEIKILDVWAKPIDFSYVSLKGQKTIKNGLVGSVKVARDQCAQFLAKNGLTLQDYNLTTDALMGYLNGDSLEGVLVAPGTPELERFDVIQASAANPNNFTSFIRLVPYSSTESFEHAISGVALPSLKTILSDSTSSFFDKLFEGIAKIDDIPRPIFVFDRKAKVGMLFEGDKIFESDMLDVEAVQEGSISVYDDVGSLQSLYSEHLKNLCETKFDTLVKGDFIFHQGNNTCLFACPNLGIFTHGYIKEYVEPVFRFYIHKLFELHFVNGMLCSPEQKMMFEQHKEAWQKNPTNFFEFVNVIDK